MRRVTIAAGGERHTVLLEQTGAHTYRAIVDEDLVEVRVAEGANVEAGENLVLIG